MSYLTQDYRWTNNFFVFIYFNETEKHTMLVIILENTSPLSCQFSPKYTNMFVWNIFSYMNAENKYLKLNKNSEEHAKCFWHKLFSFPATILSSKSWLLHVIFFGYTILVCNFNHHILWSLRNSILFGKGLVLPYLKGRGILTLTSKQRVLRYEKRA